MDVPDATRVLLQESDRIAATVRRVTGVEHEPQERVVAAGHQLVDFPGRLDVAAAVRVKHGPKPCLVFDGRGDSLGAARKRCPLIRRQSISTGDAASVLLAPGNESVGVRQDDERVAGAGIAHQSRRPNGHLDPFVVRRLVGQGDGNEGP